MSTVLRGKRAAYDNIANGSATGPERTIAGDTVSKVEMPGGGFRTSTSTGDEWHTNVAGGSSVTDQVADGTVAAGAVPENLVAAATTNTNEELGSSNIDGMTS